MIKKYMEVIFKINRKDQEAFEYHIHEITPLGMEIIDSREISRILGNLKNDEISDLEIEDRDYVIVKTYLSFDENYERSMEEIEKLKEKFDFTMEKNEVENDWAREWMKFYKPIEVGKNILILPKWMDRDSEKIKIYINPGMAFGTGSHETTKLVLSEIEKYDIEDKRALDIGVGSGILSILLRKLKAKSVLGVDIDEDAINSARENLSYNGVDKIELKESDLFSNVEGEFDLICANLLSEIIVRMMDEVDEYLKKDGLLILSGIIEESEYKVRDKLKEKSFRIIDRKKDGDWIMLSCKKEKDV